MNTVEYVEMLIQTEVICYRQLNIVMSTVDLVYFFCMHVVPTINSNDLILATNIANRLINELLRAGWIYETGDRQSYQTNVRAHGFVSTSEIDLLNLLA